MISIILTAYKESATIGKAIESILENNLRDFEILAVCPDRETAEVIAKYSNKDKRIKHIQDPGQGKPTALNLVLKKARGDILVLTDGDVYVGKNAISSMLEKFKPGIGAVTGHPVSLNSKSNMLGFWSHLLSDTAHRRRMKAIITKQRIFCSGYLYAFRKGLITHIPPETLSEDGLISHMIYSKGYGIAYSPESLVYIKYPSSFRDWIIQKRRSAGGYNQIKMWIGSEIRSFRKESLGIFQVLAYPKTISELLYTLLLIPARLYLWILIFLDVNIRKKELKKLWLRAKSTK